MNRTLTLADFEFDLPPELIAQHPAPVRSGSRLLDQEAMRAVRGWKFRPATQNGRPAAGWVIVPIDFRLQ